MPTLLLLLLELGYVGKSDIIDLVFTVNLALIIQGGIITLLLFPKAKTYRLMLVINDMPAIILGRVIRKRHVVMVSILGLVDIQRDNPICVSTTPC